MVTGTDYYRHAIALHALGL